MNQTMKSLFLAAALTAVGTAVMAIDINTIPGPDAAGRVGASMPYTRYESEEASLGGGALIRRSTGIHMTDIAAQASEHSYVALPQAGAYAEWTAVRSGNGVTMRFTMPDATSGTDGRTGSLDVYVNGTKVKTVSLTSYWMWQYFDKNIGGSHTDNASDTYIAGATACFAFDDVSFVLPYTVRKGDLIRIQSSGDGGMEYGVDFIDVEKTAPLERPAGSVSLTDYNGDWAAAMSAAQGSAARTLYIPEGDYEYWGKLNLYGGIKIMGAGLFYTRLMFTNPGGGGGGIVGANDTELCHLALNTRMHSRMNQAANYKGLEGGPSNYFVHDLMVQHFECGAWFEHGNNIRVVNCRLMDNFADGLNFCRATNNSTIYNCVLRNNGDDGVGMWNVEEEYNDRVCYNTVEFDWRAGGIGVFGGVGHQIYNNYIVHSVYAAGIRVNTDFPGPAFSNTAQSPILIANNTVVCSGANPDIFGGQLPSVDLRGGVNNVNFENTKIYGSHWDDVRNQTGNAFNYTLLTSDPGYPPVDDEEEEDSPIDGLTGYDVALTALSWKNTGGSSDLKQGDRVTFTARLTNTSTVDIPAGVVIGLGLSVDNGQRTESLSNNSYKDGLRAGESILLTAEWTATAGGITVLATADPGNRLPEELSKANNLRTKRLNVTATEQGVNHDYTPTSGRDLYVTDVTWENLTRNDGTIEPGDRLRFTAHVVNAGSEATEGGQKHGVKFIVDGQDYPAAITWNDLFYGPLNAHATETLAAVGGNEQTDGTWIATTGSHRVTAWVNDDNSVSNENTGNNQTTVSLPTIPYAGIQYLDNPDQPDDLDNPAGIARPTATAATRQGIYDLQGRYHGTDGQGLRQGIYIVGGKKTIRRR